MGKEDILLKSYLGDVRRYADLWNGALFCGEQLVKPEELEEISPVLLKGGGIFLEKRRDLVMKQNRDGQYFAILVVENQKNIDYSMPVRIALEEALAYHCQIKEIRKTNEKADKEYQEGKSQKVYADAGERLYMFRKEDKLKPVATMIVYWGEKAWQGPKSLHDLIDFGREEPFNKQLRKLIPEYPLHFLDLNYFQHFEYFKTELRPFLELYKKRNNKEEFQKYVQENKKYWKMDKETLYVFSHLTNSKNLKELIKSEQEKKEGEKGMCKAIDGWIEDVKEEGRIEGKMEGKIEGKRESVLTLLESFGEISDGLRKKIAEQTNALVLVGWIKLAAKAKSIEEFSFHMDKLDL